MTQAGLTAHIVYKVLVVMCCSIWVWTAEEVYFSYSLCALFKFLRKLCTCWLDCIHSATPVRLTLSPASLSLLHTLWLHINLVGTSGCNRKPLILSICFSKYIN